MTSSEKKRLKKFVIPAQAILRAVREIRYRLQLLLGGITGFCFLTMSYVLKEYFAPILCVRTKP